MSSILLNLLRETYLRVQNMVDLGEYSMRRLCVLLPLCVFFKRQLVQVNCVVQVFYFLIFYLFPLKIMERGVLKYPVIIGDFSTSLSSISFCFSYLKFYYHMHTDLGFSELIPFSLQNSSLPLVIFLVPKS